jgi:hypothetical protein
MSFLQGIEFQIIGDFFVSGLHYGLLQKFKHYFDAHNIIDKFKAVLLASILTTLVSNPIKAIHINMIMDNISSKESIRTIYQYYFLFNNL